MQNVNTLVTWSVMCEPVNETLDVIQNSISITNYVKQMYMNELDAFIFYIQWTSANVDHWPHTITNNVRCMCVCVCAMCELNQFIDQFGWLMSWSAHITANFSFRVQRISNLWSGSVFTSGNFNSIQSKCQQNMRQLIRCQIFIFDEVFFLSFQRTISIRDNIQTHRKKKKMLNIHSVTHSWCPEL